jgi:PAS domain-containing protein
LLISYSDSQGRIKRINPNFCTILEHPIKDVVGHTYKIVNHPEMPSIIFKHLWGQIRSGEKTDAIILNVTKNRKSCWLHTSIEPKQHLHNGVVYEYAAYQQILPPHVVKNASPFYEELIKIQVINGFKASEEYFERYMQQTGGYDKFLFEIEKGEFSIGQLLRKIARL